MSDFDILVPGELNPDLVLTGDGIMPRFGQHELLVENMQLTIGSSPAIFACAAARLGLRVVFVGVVGDDLFGRFMCDSLQERGVDVSHVIVDPSVRTGISVILSRGNDRAILTYPGSVAALSTGQIPTPLLARCRAIHISSYFLQKALQPGLPDLLQQARANRLVISLDTNWDPAEQWDSGLESVYPLVDVLLPNEQEAQHLGKASSWEQGARTLAARVKEVVVKRGANGAALVSSDTYLAAEAFFTTVVDTTGAGDNFDAGYLFGYLQGWSPHLCLKLGLACGAISVQGLGGTSRQPTLEEALMVANEEQPVMRPKHRR